ncbi:MAG TPA: septation protein IspZ [Allosphingosinicella sp.]|jgi:intracellular septation protein A
MYNLFYAGRPIIVDSLGVIFFAALVALGLDPAQAAAIGVATTVGHVAILKFLRRPVAPLQWMSLVLVLASGLATYATNDPRFVMVKPSLVYVAIGVVMMKPGWMLRYIPPVAKAHVEDVATRFGYVWAGLFFVTALANLVVALLFTAWWPAFVAAVPLASKLILFAVQFIVTRRVARARIRRAGAGAAPVVAPNSHPVLCL